MQTSRSVAIGVAAFLATTLAILCQTAVAGTAPFA